MKSVFYFFYEIDIRKKNVEFWWAAVKKFGAKDLANVNKDVYPS